MGMKHGRRTLARTMVAAAFLVTAVSAQAVLIDDGPLTTDTDTGRRWLDFDRSFGLSYNQVVAETGRGGSLEGFRHATRAELTTFWRNAGIVHIDVYDTAGNPLGSAANYAPIVTLLNLTDATFARGSFFAAFAIDDDPAPLPGSHFLSFFGVDQFSPFGPVGQAVTRLGGVDDDATAVFIPGVGTIVLAHWLVSVPEPAPAGLLGLALLLMAAVARSRRATPSW